jgi:hypothetical protein
MLLGMDYDGPALEQLSWGECMRLVGSVALNPWLSEKRDHFIRISPAITDGRRVRGQLQAGGTSARHF